jgi:hypothetical protein
MTMRRTAVGVLGAFLTLAACGGGDDAAPASAPVTLAVASSVPGSMAITGAAPSPTVASPTDAPPPTTIAAPPPTTTPPPPTTPPPTPPPPTTPPTPAALPCAVVAVGDSVGQDLFNNGLGASLADVGCELAGTTGARGITMQEGAAYLARARDVPANVALVLLGYHNAVSQTRSGHFPAFIDAVVDAAGDRTVVWALPGRTPDCGASFTNAMAVEAQLVHEAAGRWPNLVAVDYPSVINAHPEYSQNRCPHLVNSGSRAVGMWLAGEVRRIVDTSG